MVHKVADKVVKGDAEELDYLRSDLFKVKLEPKKNAGDQRHLTTAFENSFVRTNENSNRTDNMDSIINENKVATFLPSLDQADHDKESTSVKIPPASFTAQLKNEKDNSLSKSKAKLKTRGRGRSRGGRGSR